MAALGAPGTASAVGSASKLGSRTSIARVAALRRPAAVGRCHRGPVPGVRGPAPATAPPPALTGHVCAAAHARQNGSVIARAEKKELMMWEALREGLDEEMEKDPLVCLMGEPAAPPGAEARRPDAHRQRRARLD